MSYLIQMKLDHYMLKLRRHEVGETESIILRTRSVRLR